MTVIKIPARLNLKKAIEFSNHVQALTATQELHFDFEKLVWVEPFGMLFLAQTIRNLRNQLLECDFIYKNLNFENATSYASHMAFFTACGFSIGNRPGFKSPNNTYIPITYVESRQLRTRDAIEEISMELACQLTQESKGILVDTLSYSFREMIRNVIEHSQSELFGYCAQYWPNKNLVEVAILDTGVGLRHTLAPNPHLSINNDQDAIKFALMPGISGKTYEGVKIRHEDVWQNSGYGLYMNYRLCNEGGNFFLCSGSKGLFRTTGSDNMYFETNFQGTALRLQLHTTTLRDVSSMLKQFSDEGENLARQIGMGAVPTASTMSKMLKNNFKYSYDIEFGDTVMHRQYGEGIISEKLTTPQGQMFWVEFKGGRRKKILAKDLAVVNIDTETYIAEDVEYYHNQDDFPVIDLSDYGDSDEDLDTF